MYQYFYNTIVIIIGISIRYNFNKINKLNMLFHCKRSLKFYSNQDLHFNINLTSHFINVLDNSSIVTRRSTLDLNDD